MKKLMLLSIIFLSACNGPFNEGVEDSFTEEGCLVQKGPAPKKLTYHINFFLETSQSMAGLMPTGKATEFQTTMWDLIAGLGQGSQGHLQLFQLRSRQESPQPIRAVPFRKELNDGKFKFGQATDIPEMVDSVLAKTPRNTVSILVSDLIFSPPGNSPALFAQFKTDIRTRFAGKQFGSAILQLHSAFYYQKAKMIQARSPYYIWVIGEPAQVKDLTQRIKAQVKIDNEITHGLGPVNADYSILPYAVTNATAVAGLCATDRHYYCLTEWDQTPEMEVALAVNFSGLSERTPIKQRLLPVNTPTKINITQVSTQFDLKPTDDQLRTQLSATHYLRLKISGLSQESNLITLNIKDQKPDWVVNVDQNADGVRTGTRGLNALVDGLEQALPRKKDLLIRPIRLLITKRTY